jgi:hypothetical protein
MAPFEMQGGGLPCLGGFFPERAYVQKESGLLAVQASLLS